MAAKETGIKTDRNQISTTVSRRTVKQLSEIMEHYGWTKREALMFAIDNYYYGMLADRNRNAEHERQKSQAYKLPEGFGINVRREHAALGDELTYSLIQENRVLVSCDTLEDAIDAAHKWQPGNTRLTDLAEFLNEKYHLTSREVDSSDTRFTYPVDPDAK